LPQWREAGAPILALTRVHPRQKKLIEAFCRYITRRQEAWEALVLALQKNDWAKVSVFKTKWAEADRIANEITTMVKQRE
jgi:hypothetical protein